jgi:hypothetical protein
MEGWELRRLARERAGAVSPVETPAGRQMYGAAEMSSEQAATDLAYFPDGSTPAPTEYDAHVHARVFGTEEGEVSPMATILLQTSPRASSRRSGRASPPSSPSPVIK